MNNYKLPYFENIDLDSIEDYYSVDIEFQGYTIQLDLNFEKDSSDKSSIDLVNGFIENLADYSTKAHNAIINDFKTDETVREYIEHHLEDIDIDELDILLIDTDKTLSTEEQLMSKFRLERVGFYPEDENDFAIFDYTIGRHVTNYLIVIKFDSNGSIVDLTMES